MTDANNTTTQTNNRDQFKIDKEQMSVLFHMLLDASEENPSESYHGVLALVQKIGYPADKGVGHAGGSQHKGGAEERFLPPSYHWAKEARTDQLDGAEA